MLSSFSFFYRYLFSKRSNSVVRRVSLICFLGLVVSIGSLLIVFNVMGGLGQSIKESFLDKEPHVIISLEENLSAHLIHKKKTEIKTLFKSLELDSGVSAFYFFENVDMIIRSSKGAFTGAVAKGYSTDDLESLLQKMQKNSLFPVSHLDQNSFESENSFRESENSFSNGQEKPLQQKNSLQVVEKKILDKTLFFIDELGSKKETKNIIMNLSLASEMDFYEEDKVYLTPAENLLLPPGDTIPFDPVRISSIITMQNFTQGMNYIFYNRDHFPYFRDTSSYRAGFEIRLKDPEQFLLYKNALAGNGFKVEVWPERNASVFFALKIEKTVMSVFLSLAGLITLLAIASLLVLLMVQKKKEIGILMAMGFYSQKIQNLFVGIGMYLSLFGMFGAWLVSLVVFLVLKYATIPVLAQFHTETEFPVEFNILFMVLLFITVIILAFAMCILSVRSQLSRSPAELLKTINH